MERIRLERACTVPATLLERLKGLGTLIHTLCLLVSSAWNSSFALAVVRSFVFSLE